MAHKAYHWGLIGIESGHIDYEKGKFRAAFLRGATFRPYDKFLSDLLKRGAEVVAVSDPVYMGQDRDREKDAPVFPPLSPAEQLGVNCIVFFQAAKLCTDLDLPREKQRLTTYSDTSEKTPQEMGLGAKVFISWQAGIEQAQQQREAA